MKKTYLLAGTAILMWSTMATISKLMLSTMGNYQVLCISSLLAFLCHSLLLLPPIPPSIRVNSSYEVAKVSEFSFSISPSKEIPRLISFRMDWLDLLAVQGTLKSLLQHHTVQKQIGRAHV